MLRLHFHYLGHCRAVLLKLQCMLVAPCSHAVCDTSGVCPETMNSYLGKLMLLVHRPESGERVQRTSIIQHLAIVCPDGSGSRLMKIKTLPH